MSDVVLRDEFEPALRACVDEIRAAWQEELLTLRRRAETAEAQVADLAGCIRVELQGVIEEVEAFNRCTQFKVLLAQREEGSTWGVWSLPLPSADAARALGANLYRPTSAVVFLRVPEAP